MEDYTSVDTRLPKNNEKVQMKFICDGEVRVIRGFFYINDTRPEFVAFGSEVENVVAWKPCNSNMGF